MQIYFYQIQTPTFYQVRGIECNGEVFYAASEVAQAFRIPYFYEIFSKISHKNKRYIELGEDESNVLFINQAGIDEMLLHAFRFSEKMQVYIDRAIAFRNSSHQL